MKVIIVGGGVGGCSAAIFLKKIGMQVSLYEKYPTPPVMHTGAGLGLGSNGFSTLALYSKELADAVYTRGHRAPFWEMRDYDGTILGLFPGGREDRYGGYGTACMRRWDVHDVLLKEAETKGIKVEYGKQVVSVKEDTKSARVQFSDGSTEEADLIIGADGARSKVREFVAPSAKVVHTGFVGVGSFIPKATLSFSNEYFESANPAKKEVGAIMTYGPLGFFGFGPCDNKTAEEGGQYMWWSSYYTEDLTDTVADATFASKPEDVLKELDARHGTWHTPIPEVLDKAKDTNIVVLPEYALSGMTDYHTSRVVLVGDAAHVFQPHTGQGVSQTLEDVACLTQFLRPFAASQKVDSEALRSALAQYQTKRKPRVDKILAIGAKVGQDKHRKGRIGCFVRKWSMLIFLKFFVSEKMMDETFDCQYTRESVFGSSAA